jgi:hypothetical protein
VIEPVDLGVCRGYDYAGSGPVAFVLPGRMLAGMPVNAFAIQPLVARGRRVVQVWDEYLDDSVDGVSWVLERLDAAARFAGSPPAPLVVAKSLSTLAAPVLAKRGWPSVLLTPVLELLPARLQAASVLSIGGTADPSWDAEHARRLGEVVELEGADHGLARVADLAAVADAVGAFADRI